MDGVMTCFSMAHLKEHALTHWPLNVYELLGRHLAAGKALSTQSLPAYIGRTLGDSLCSSRRPDIPTTLRGSG